MNTSLFAHRDGVGSNPGAEDWFQADQWCQAHNGFLVQIDSAEENNAIMEATGRKNGYHIWLGLTKFSGNWTLSSVGHHDQKPDFLKPIHPITYELYGNCASMDVHVGSWAERPCGRVILIQKILFLQLLHGFKLFHLVSDFQNSFCF